MFFSPRPSAGSTVRVPPLFILSSLLLLSLPTANALRTTDSNDAAAKHYARSTSPTESGLPPVVIISIIGSAVFFLVIGSILLYFYLRRRRERARRGEHREKAWQFKDMQRNGQGPNLKPVGKSKSGATVQISYPVLMPEATSSPRIPTTAFYL